MPDLRDSHDDSASTTSRSGSAAAAEAVESTDGRYRLDLPRMVALVASGELPVDALTMRIIGAFAPDLTGIPPEIFRTVCARIVYESSLLDVTVEQLLEQLAGEVSADG